ncbi:hypothetical protein J4Q44_G00224400 [Coregonus suidteri]|uniref:Uncharacterized protein n=1 Tax=Coregonus suidteri TaxID=861788 RepID=A0AAN8L856_9TELE
MITPISTTFWEIEGLDLEEKESEQTRQAPARQVIIYSPTQLFETSFITRGTVFTCCDLKEDLINFCLRCLLHLIIILHAFKVTKRPQ